MPAFGLNACQYYFLVHYVCIHIRDELSKPLVDLIEWRINSVIVVATNSRLILLYTFKRIILAMQCNNDPGLNNILNNLIALQWRHNGRNSVSNHQPFEYLLSRLIRRRSKKTSKLHVTGLCAGNSPETGEFPAQRASNAENVSIWWRHHARRVTWPQNPHSLQRHYTWASWRIKSQATRLFVHWHVG